MKVEVNPILDVIYALLEHTRNLKRELEIIEIITGLKLDSNNF